MTPAEFQKRFAERLNEIKRYSQKDLPRIIGKLAVDHYHENFMLGGYVNDKLQPWKPAKRIGLDKTAASGYGTLLSARKELYNSIRSRPSDGRVTIISSLRYSRIHNEGGTIVQPVTPKMRKFAWAKYYESNKTAEGWKGMALTKKTSLTIVIPQRRFMGKSIELNRQIQSRVIRDVKRILINN